MSQAKIGLAPTDLHSLLPPPQHGLSPDAGPPTFTAVKSRFESQFLLWIGVSVLIHLLGVLLVATGVVEGSCR